MGSGSSRECAAAASFVAALALVAGGACGPDEGETLDTGDGHWDARDDGRTDGSDVLPDGDDCDDRARWVYLVAEDMSLIRFRPDDLSMTVIGTLDCSGADPGTTPFSMSVDRDATAWVLYSAPLLGAGGKLFRVSTADASCSSTSFVPGQEGFEVFGMGFVSDAAGSDAETLFVAGGSTLSIGTGSSNLGSIDMGSLVLRRIAAIPGWPELTGTGLGELWGFMPDRSPRVVQKIDKATGAVSNTYDLAALGTDTTEAWAFAFWGGDFFIFLKTVSDTSTNVWKLETDDGSVVEAIHDTGRKIVGAGVSTCAPVVII